MIDHQPLPVGNIGQRNGIGSVNGLEIGQLIGHMGQGLLEEQALLSSSPHAFCYCLQKTAKQV